MIMGNELKDKTITLTAEKRSDISLLLQDAARAEALMVFHANKMNSDPIEGASCCGACEFAEIVLDQVCCLLCWLGGFDVVRYFENLRKTGIVTQAKESAKLNTVS